MPNADEDKEPEIISQNILAIQVCVPDNFADKEIIEFAERANPCMTENGWFVREKDLDGNKQKRVACEKRTGFTHVILEA